MTDSTDFRRVKETEALAKRLGFKIETKSGGVVLRTAKGLPEAVFGKNIDVIVPYSVEEVRAWMRGWANLAAAIEEVGFDIAEYNKRLEDLKLVNALKGKKVK